jgi:hypothetical protein
MGLGLPLGDGRPPAAAAIAADRGAAVVGAGPLLMLAAPIEHHEWPRPCARQGGPAEQEHGEGQQVRQTWGIPEQCRCPTRKAVQWCARASDKAGLSQDWGGCRFLEGRNLSNLNPDE